MIVEDYRLKKSILQAKHSSLTNLGKKLLTDILKTYMTGDIKILQPFTIMSAINSKTDFTDDIFCFQNVKTA